MENIYVGSHRRHVTSVIRNRSNSRSRGDCGERANVASKIWPQYRTTRSNLNVILMFRIWKQRWYWDRKSSCMFGESSFRKSSPTVHLFTCFDIQTIKILRTMSLVLGENEARLQSWSFAPRETQTQVSAIYIIPPSQSSRVQNAKYHNFNSFISIFKMRCEDKPWTRGPWTPISDRVHGPLNWTRSMHPR